MRKKNLILLTSITGLLLTITPSQALAQESTTPTTSQSQTDNDKKEDNKDDDIRLASEDKCHWNNEVPVPENKYLKLLYDYSMKFWDKSEFDITNSKVNREVEPLKKLVDDGKMSEKEAQYRSEIIQDALSKKDFSSNLHFEIQDPIDPERLKELVDETYDNPDNADEIVQEIIDSYSLKEYFNYIQEYIDPDHHAIYADPELRNKYQKEFDELDKTIDYDKDQNNVWNKTENFKVTKKLDKYSSDEEQIQRFIDLYYWLDFFQEKYDSNIPTQSRYDYTSLLTKDIPDLYNIIKEKGLDNDDFYEEAKNYLKDNHLFDQSLSIFLQDEYDIIWHSKISAKASDYTLLKLEQLLYNPDIEIPYNVTCDDEESPGDEETPGEDNDTTTKPDTPEDKTTPTTKTTSKKDKPSNKTSTKSSDKSTISTTTTTNEDKEEESISTPTPTTEPNQPTIPNQVNTPNNPLTPNQEFTPVNNSKPGTFTSGVSSSVDGEEVSEGGKVDTGSPTTSILNKIRTIF